MADKRLNIKIRTDGAKKAKGALGGVDRSMKTLAKSAMAAGAAFFGARAIISGIKTVINLEREQTLAVKKLETALGKNSSALQKQASALQQVTTFGDETIIQAQAMLAMFIKDEEQLKKATIATLDLAAAKGMDLVQAADLVGKSVGSSTNALARYGVSAEGAAGSSERLNSIVDGMTKYFGGQATAVVDTMAGSLDQMSNAVGDVGEIMGEKLSPIVTGVSKAIKGFAEAVGDYIAIPASQKIKEEAADLRVLVRSITMANEGSGQRKRLIDELQKVYPDFLKNIDAETVTNEELNIALKANLEEYKKKAIMTLLDKKRVKAFDDVAVAEYAADTALQNYIEHLSELEELTGVTVDSSASMREQFNQLSLAVEDMGMVFGGMDAWDEALAVQLNLGEAMNKYFKTQKSAVGLNKDAAIVQEELNATMERLGIILSGLDGTKTGVSVSGEDEVDTAVFDEYIAKQQEMVDLKAQEAEWLDVIREMYPDLAEQMGLMTVATETASYTWDTFKKNLDQAAAASILTASSITSTSDALGAAEEAAKKAASSFISAEIQKAVSKWIASMLQSSGPMAWAVAPIALAGGAAFGSLMGSTIERFKFAKGGDFVTSGPQMITVGDNPGGRERVQVTPLSSPNIDGPQGGITINISAPLVDETVIDSIIPAIEKAQRLNLA